jgi:hypothetical protein
MASILPGKVFHRHTVYHLLERTRALSSSLSHFYLFLANSILLLSFFGQPNP